MSNVTWLLPQTPVTENELANFSSVSDYPLPEDFKLWLLKHNGACPEPSEILSSEGFTFIINSFVSFSGKDTPNVLSILKMLKGRISKGLLPIAEDHGGNYVCFRCLSTTAEPDVVLWDHEEANQGIGIKPVAASFTELVQLLARGKC
jgi:hypothetical protein